MNHHHDDTSYFHQSTSSSTTPSTSSAVAYSVYTQKLPSEQVADDTLPSMESDQMNAFMDDYYDDDASDGTSSKSQHHRSTADEDLETLLKETDDMRHIQEQLQMEDLQMGGANDVAKYRDERSRQKRAAAARSRYQRMSENERRAYNQRRRLRQLGVDPTSPEQDPEDVKAQLKVANARKAEAARQRYHRMTPEQKRDYNHRRTEAFRRRRQEEETLLSTPAGRISQEALAKAQQIMVRNARKAESARLRYQRMTQEQRKAYNMKRASAKKTRRGEEREDGGYLEYHDEYMDPMQGDVGEEEMIVVDPHRIVRLQDLTPSNQGGVIDDEDVEIDPTTCEEHLLNVINEVAHPPDELGVFAQMESEVIRRTKKANATIMKQNNHHYHHNHHHHHHQITATAIATTPLVNGHYDFQQQSSPDDCTLADAEILANLNQIVEDPIHQNNLEPIDTMDTISSGQNNNQIPNNNQNVIDEKALHDMVTSGHDVNGLPVEVRTVDGQAINCIEDLLRVSHGHTVLITHRVVEQKPVVFSNLIATPSMNPTTSSSIDIHFNGALLDQPDDYDYDDEEDIDLSNNDLKKKLTRARRAERARARYHKMSDDKRREQNARRARTLRLARARDEELLKIAENTPADQIDEATSVAIKEAQDRRARRAEQARSKYRRMTSEEKKRFNFQRDQQRRLKRDSSISSITKPTEIVLDFQTPPDPSTSPPVDQVDASSFFY